MKREGLVNQTVFTNGYINLSQKRGDRVLSRIALLLSTAVGPSVPDGAHCRGAAHLVSHGQEATRRAKVGLKI